MLPDKITDLLMNTGKLSEVTLEIDDCAEVAYPIEDLQPGKYIEAMDCLIVKYSKSRMIL